MRAKSVLTCTQSETCCSLTLNIVLQHHCNISCLGQAMAHLLTPAKLIPSLGCAELLQGPSQISHCPKQDSGDANQNCLPSPSCMIFGWMGHKGTGPFWKRSCSAQEVSFCMQTSCPSQCHKQRKLILAHTCAHLFPLCCSPKRRQRYKILHTPFMCLVL